MTHTIEFIKKHLQLAYAVSIDSGINYLAILAQAAVETGWGKSVKSNNYFGIKGVGEVIRTRETLDSPDLSYLFLKVYSITEVSGGWNYIVDDYFRGYDSASESFFDYAKFIHENSRYSEALKVKQNYRLYLKEIAAAGYATDPNYAAVCTSVASMIRDIIEEDNLEVTIKS